MAGECTDVTRPEKCALQWATEANKHICSYVLRDGENTGNDSGDQCGWVWHGPDDLSLEYYDGAVPIIEDLVLKSGKRLGAWINELAAQRAAAGENFRVQGGEGEWEL